MITAKHLIKHTLDSQASKAAALDALTFYGKKASSVTFAVDAQAGSNVVKAEIHTPLGNGELVVDFQDAKTTIVAMLPLAVSMFVPLIRAKLDETVEPWIRKYGGELLDSYALF